MVLSLSVAGPSIAAAQQLSLSWVDNSGGQAGFIVQRAPGAAGPYAQIAQVPPGVVSYTDTAVLLGTTYCYQVAAVGSAGMSAFSNPACGSPSGGFSLTVAKGRTGAGTVTSNPAAINCGTTCSYSFAAGKAITLTAVAAAGSTFTAWAGGGCGGTAPCTLVGNASTTVTATFATAGAPLTVNTVAPNQGSPGASVPITITGSGFVAGGTLNITGAGITAGSVTVVSPTQLNATLIIASGAALGARDVTVTNAGGGGGTLTNAFTVIAAATVSSMSPNQGPPGAAGLVTITRTGFVGGATVSVSGVGVSVSNVTRVSATQLTATLTVGSGAALGTRDVTVTNPNGGAATLLGGFTVIAGMTVNSMTPNQGPPGAVGLVTITGSGFVAETTASVTGGGVTMSSVPVVSATQLTTTLTVNNAAALGSRDVVVTNPDGVSGTLTNGFTVIAAVTVSSMTPSRGAPGVTVPVTIAGSAFASGATVNVGSGVTASNVAVVSPTQLTATLTVASGAALGARDVTVTNPGGGGRALTGGFTVASAAPASLTLAYNGKLRDRVGPANTALGPDGALDGTLTATLTAGGGRTVTALRLDSNAPGTWDTTSATGFWMLAVASSLDGAVLNAPGTMAVNFPVADGGSFLVFASDLQGIEFLPGRTLTLTATFSDGTTATAATTVATPVPAKLTISYNGKLRDRVGQGNTALSADGALDGTLTATLAASGGRTVTALRLDSSAPGTWDTTSNTGFWALAVAPSLDGATLNAPGTMEVNFPVADGGSFIVFASDYLGTEFLPGRRLTLTATFSDGSVATAVTTAP